MKKITCILWALALLLPFSQAWAAEPLSRKDSLSADGPYILYGANGVNVIRVDTRGNILQNHWDQLPENYTFQVTDHRGLVMKEAKRRPVSADTLDLIRNRYDVDHIIVGHTIFKNVKTFYNGRVIDVNVNNAENRRKHRSRALLIENGRYYSVTDNGKRKQLR